MFAAIWRLTAWLALDLYTGHVIAGVRVVKCCPVQMCSSDSTAMVAEVHRNSLFSLVSDCPLPAPAELANVKASTPITHTHSIFRRAMASVTYDPPLTAYCYRKNFHTLLALVREPNGRATPQGLGMRSTPRLRQQSRAREEDYQRTKLEYNEACEKRWVPRTT